jgi:hypothetical protein
LKKAKGRQKGLGGVLLIFLLTACSVSVVMVAMPRILRIQYAGARYYVINRGNYRANVFSSEGAIGALRDAGVPVTWIAEKLRMRKPCVSAQYLFPTTQCQSTTMKNEKINNTPPSPFGFLPPSPFGFLWLIYWFGF